LILYSPFLTASLNFNGLVTNYIFYSDPFEVYDFEVDGAGTTWVTDSRTLYNEIGDVITDLSGTANTKIEFVASNPTMTGIAQQGIMAEIVIEPVNNLGREFRLHSDLVWSEIGNPLFPESGETNVKIVVDLIAKTVTLSCLINGELLEPSTNYNIYYHIYE
jgi:hypothetical protein